jgi:hypothetical protein
LIFDYFLKSVKIRVSLNRTRITGTLHVDQYTFLSYYLAQFLLE